MIQTNPEKRLMTADLLCAILYNLARHVLLCISSITQLDPRATSRQCSALCYMALPN
jgi:hypothetical protein